MAKALKFNDFHLILLSTAAKRGDGAVLPFADSVTADRGRLTRAVSGLLRHGLIAEQPVTDPGQSWREEQDDRFGLVLTSAGRAAIGADAPGSEPEPDQTPRDRDRRR